MGAEFYADRRIDGYDEANRRFSQICKQALKLLYICIVVVVVVVVIVVVVVVVVEMRLWLIKRNTRLMRYHCETCQFNRVTLSGKPAV